MKVLLVEDHEMFNELLSKACQTRPEFSEVVSVTTATQAELELKRGRYSLMILDIHLPDADGFDFSAKALQIAPSLRILGISAHCNDYTMHRLSQSPLNGFINKSADTVDELWQAVDRMNRGLKYLSSSIETSYLKFKLASPNSFHKVLSLQELEILSNVGAGLDDIAIGIRLRISHETVKWHRKRIMHKLALNNRSELVVYANEKGLASLSPR